MRGTVVRLVKDRGFIFVRDAEGNDRFIHANHFVVASEFDDVSEGSVLTFDPIGEGDRSLRGVNVRIDTRVVPPSNRMHTCEVDDDPACEACAELLRHEQPAR